MMALSVHDKAFFGGLSAALAVIVIHDNPVIWREIIESACDPRQFRAWCKREGLLEICGFDMYADEYRQILQEGA